MALIRIASAGVVAVLAAGAHAAPFRQPVNGDVVVTAYFDHGGVQDWNCGNNTYGGHRGTDIAIIGRFAAQDEGRDVAAAQAGRVTRRHDGEFDRCTTADCGGGGGYGNHVYLEHPDGQVTIYAHLRQGSVRVQEGQQVNCGDIVGQVGSSGYSTGPHLHFEVKNGGASDDPFSGPCGGPLNWWVNQGAYNALPTRDCAGGNVEPPPPPPPPPPPSRPDMHLELAVSAEAPRACDFDECRDFIRDGSSAGLFDAWVGERLVAHLVVHNRGNAGTQPESPEDAAIEVQYQVPAGLTVRGYAIESDWPAQDRATWGPNDAMQNPANPAADAPPAEGVLRLNGFSPNESKRVTLLLEASARTLESGHASLRMWVRHLRGHYGERTSWDDAVETNDGQTWNGGDLRAAFDLDVYDPKAFLFDAPEAEQREGWRICGDAASIDDFGVNTESKALVARVVGAAPCFESPRLQVPLAGLRGVRLEARQWQGPRTGRLAWTTEAAPDFDDARTVPFTLGGAGRFEEVHLGPMWAADDVLTRLRLLPVDDPGTGNPWVDVAALRVVEDAPPGTPEAPDGPDGPGGPAGGGDGVGFEFDGGVVGPPSGPGAAGDDNAKRGTALSGGCAQGATRGSSAALALFALALVGLRRRGRSARR